MLDKIGGWFVAVYGILLIFSLIILPSILSLSPAQTEFVNFYKNSASQPFILFGLTILIYFITKRSIFPIGQHDPERYPAQMLGYNTSLIISLVVGILLFAFFYSVVSTTKEVFIPVPQLLVPGLSVEGQRLDSSKGIVLQIASFSRNFFSGQNPIGNAVSNSFMPTFYENPMYMYLPMMIIWLSADFILSIVGVPKLPSNLIGMILGVLASGLMFAIIAHSQAYQDYEPAYTKAIVFVSSCALPTALTGFPLPCDLAHISNNWAASFFSVVRFVSVIAPIYAILFFIVPKNRLKFKNKVMNVHNYIKQFYSQKVKIHMSNMRYKFISILMCFLLISPMLVEASFFGDLFDKIKNSIPLSTTSGFTTLSVSRADMMSRDPKGLLTGEVLMLQISTGGFGNLGQYAYAGSTNAFESLDIDGKVTQYDIKIDVESKDQEAHYTVKDNVQGDLSIRQFYLLDCGNYLFTSNNECLAKIPHDNYKTIFIARLSGNLFDKFVLYSVPVSIGVFKMPSSPEVKSEVDIILTRSDGKVIRGTVNNFDSPWARVGNDALAVFNGGMKLYDQPPDPQQEGILVTSAMGRKNWYLIDENKYDYWKNVVGEGFYSYYWERGAMTTKTPDQIRSIIGNWNSLSNKALKGISWEGGSFSGSDYVISLDDKISMNNIVLYIKADWLGVYTPTANVIITDVDVTDFKVGNEGTIRVTVKNIGDERASTNIGINCPSFTATTSSRTVVVYPGDTERVTLRVGSGQIDSKECDRCMVTANTLTSKSVKTISICATPSEVVEDITITPDYTEDDTSTCYQQAEASVPLWARTSKFGLKVMSFPAKIPCFLQENQPKLLYGLLLSLLTLAIMFFIIEVPPTPLVYGIVALVMFLIPLYSTWLAIGITVILLGGLIVLVRL